MKELLGLGRCQSRDFSAQIAHLSMCMIQYNILCYVKRFESYETLCGLFAEATKGTAELSLAERIWGLILEVVNVIAELLGADPVKLTEDVVNERIDIKKLQTAVGLLAPAA